MTYVASVCAPQVDKIYRGWIDIITWCDQHCKNRYRYEGEGVFRFSEEKDYVLFLLRWG